MDASNEQGSLKRLIHIGLALSSEKNKNNLIERILQEAKSLSNADGGTFYMKKEDSLEFTIIRNDTLNISQNTETGRKISLPAVPLYINNQPNLKQVASKAALTGLTINVKDAYNTEEFDFSGTKKFDQGTGYRSESFLTVPLKNHQHQCIGVLQLINAKDVETGRVIPFSSNTQPLIEALASLAAVALENNQLIKSQKHLLESFITLIASAIDEKSPYTGGHCQRVPELTNMITAKLCEQNNGKFADFNLSEEQWYELHIAGWLHDCGKITTPEYVVDKSTKLETITNRIHEIRTRVEVLKRDAEISYLKAIIDNPDKKKELHNDLQQQLHELDDDYAFIAESNIGGEFMAPDRIERIKKISERHWYRTLDDQLGLSIDELHRKSKTSTDQLPIKVNLLEDREDHLIDWDVLPKAANPNNKYGFKVKVPKYKYNFGEIYNLCIKKGTLCDEERFKINDHMAQTIVMLEELPFPKHLERVPEYAGGHHETLIGTGYPKKLSADDLSIPARAMAIADIFEALTASDRPYKKAKTLDESMQIMKCFVREQHIDGDIFEVFLRSGAYLEYANKFLGDGNYAAINIEKYL
ncbi:MAG: HD-GYP domain-containing protein (c-di-GMP phosphodiesterase class II) [Enterobacterales bacterium]|jgi:HD-GYP domain-containing protein (c-di-GMP phosphodiesterase class II)